jgi:aminoglycoside phosphotransferase (APT) family kinase protein
LSLSWNTSKEVLNAVGERELEWLRKSGRERYPREALYREFYGHQKVDPQVQIGHLLDYLKLAPHTVPREEELSTPTIRHPDLSPSNIFVSDSGELTGVIDWQHATILPIFL